MKQGFTLIELLVVVLILGVLTSIALPEYTMAVEKSRSAEAMTNGAAIMDAMRAYFDAYPGDSTGITPAKIATVQLGGKTNGTWTESDGVYTFSTKNFVYDLMGYTLDMYRGNKTSPLYTIQYSYDPSTGKVTRSCTGTGYEQICNSINKLSD